MEDKILDVKGKFDQNIEKVYIEAIGEGQFENVYVEFKDGRIVSYPRGDQSYADFASEVQSALVWFGATNNNKGRNWFVGYRNQLPSKLFKVEEEPVIEEEKEEEQILDMTVANLDTSIEGVSNVKYDKELVEANTETEESLEERLSGKKSHKGIIITTAVLAGVAIIGLAGCNMLKKDKAIDSASALNKFSKIGAANGNVTVEETVETEEVAAGYLTQQKYEKEAINFLQNYNRSEDWMYSEITGEMTEELEKMGLEVTGDEAIFGFTAEELNAFRFVFGNYTNDELVSITGGEYINVNDMINNNESDLNRAFRKIMLAYWNTDKENLDIINLGGFNEEELDRIHHYEGYLFTYKNLVKEGKKEEAEKLMREIRNDIYEYGYALDENQDKAKPFILKTLLPTFSVYSQMYQYKNDVTLNLYNAETNEYEDKVIKTNLFDEVMMRDLVEGYTKCSVDDEVVLDEFSSVEYLKHFNIDTNKYTIVISDDGVSKADQFNSGLVDKLEEFNNYLNMLRAENAAADAINENDDNSKYDKLIKGTKTLTEMNELINSDLEFGNKYPKNTAFFSSIYSKFVKEFMMAKGIIDVNGNFIGNEIVNITNVRGSLIAITHARTETHTERFTVRERVSAEEMAREEAAKRAEAIARASATTAINKETGEEKATTYQDIYNNAYLKNGGKANISSNLTNGDQAKDSDTIGKAVEKMAEEDAEENKKAHEEAAKDANQVIENADGSTSYISGGNTTTYVPEGADIVSESEAERYNREHGITNGGAAPVNNGTDNSSSAPVDDAPATYGSLNDASSESGFSQALESLPDIMEDDTDNLDAAIETGSSIRRI